MNPTGRKFFSSCILFFISVMLFAAEWKAPGIAPIREGQLFDRHMSAARYIHTAKEGKDYPLTNFCRKVIEIDGAVKSAEITAFMLGSKLYCNGNVVPGRPWQDKSLRTFFTASFYDLKPYLKPGKNVIAFHSKRTHPAQSLGVCMRGEIKLASGKTILLVSDKSFKGASKAPANWMSADFDDSNWAPVHEIGDIYYGYGFVTYSDLPEMLGTKEEVAAMRKAMQLSPDQKKKLAAEPEPKAKIVWNGGVSGIQVRPGVVIPPVMGAVDGLAPYPRRDDTIAKAYKSGVRIFRFAIRPPGLVNGKGEPDWDEFDRTMQRFLQIAPEAYIMICIGDTDPAYKTFGKDFVEKHKDQLIQYCNDNDAGFTGRNTWEGKWDAFSCASEVYRKEIARKINFYASQFKKYPWSKHIIAMGYGYGPSGDGYPFGSYYGMPDSSKPMTEAFRRYAKKKYQTVAALRKAYGDTNLTFETLQVPGKVERNARGHYLHDAAMPAERKLMDYYKCYNEQFGDLQLSIGKAWKEAMPGRLFASYFGYVSLPYCPVGETADYERVLASPYLDICFATTLNYQQGSSQIRHIPSDFKHYGKLSSGEADIRTFVAVEDGTTSMRAWNHPTKESTIAAMRKVYIQALLNGGGYHLVSFHGHQSHRYWFNHPLLWTEIHRSVELWKKLWKKPVQSNADVAYVFSPREKVYNGHPTVRENWQLYQAREYDLIDAISFSGVAYDFVSLNDFLASPKKYKTAVFANVHMLNASEREKLKAKLASDKTSAVWMGAPGYASEKGFSDAAMQDLTSLPLKASLKPSPFEIVFNNDSTMEIKGYRSTRPLMDSPRVFAKEDGLNIWGRWADDKTPAIFSKQLGNGTYSIFSGLPIIQVGTFRRIFKLTKAHLYSNKAGIMVRSSDSLSMIYTAMPGRHKITLPKKAKSVRDAFSGKVLLRNGNSFYLTTNAHMAWILEIEY